jgi:hypothetical protein
MTAFTRPHCKPLGLDEPIRLGDWVSLCDSGDLSSGAPTEWVKAWDSVGKTPRQLRAFACRPISTKATQAERTASHANKIRRG